MTLAEQLETAGVVVHTNKGTSMMPLLRENRDLMVIRKRGAGRFHPYDAVLFRRDNGDYVLHRILRVEPDSYWIVGDNCAAGETVREEQVLGILTEIVRDGKTIRVTDKGYRAFVFIWCTLFPVRSLWLRTAALVRAAGKKLTGR